VLLGAAAILGSVAIGLWSSYLYAKHKLAKAVKKVQKNVLTNGGPIMQNNKNITPN
jgi:hypothetical protein